MKDKVLCTILYGDRYIRFWKAHCEANWRRYAARHGYDLVIVDRPVRLLHDLSFRPIHWQKLFLPGHEEIRRYRHAVFLDADIMINYHRAPCIVEKNNSDKIGVVSLQEFFEEDFRYNQTFLRKVRFRYYTKRQTFRDSGEADLTVFGPDRTRHYRPYTEKNDLPFINTGVMVMQPALHREILEDIYTKSVNKVTDGAAPGDYEQTFLAYELLTRNMTNLLDVRFNTIVGYELTRHYPFLLYPGGDQTLLRSSLSTILHNCFFLHFAADAELMAYTVINEHDDLAIIGRENIYRNDEEFYSFDDKGGITWTNNKEGTSCIPSQ